MSTILCSHLWLASIIFMSFISLITGKLPVSQLSRSVVYIACQEMACRHMHVLLIAGVSYNTQIMGLKILANCYIFMF